MFVGPTKKQEGWRCEIPVRLQQILLLKSFILQASNNIRAKYALVIFTVPFSAVSLCCRCLKCFGRNYNDFCKLVSSLGQEILLFNLWEKALMNYILCRIFGDWWNLTFMYLGSCSFLYFTSVNTSSWDICLCLCHLFQKDHYDHDHCSATGSMAW